jgi:hypothetical protein
MMLKGLISVLHTYITTRKLIAKKQKVKGISIENQFFWEGEKPGSWILDVAGYRGFAFWAWVKRGSRLQDHDSLRMGSPGLEDWS